MKFDTQIHYEELENINEGGVQTPSEKETNKMQLKNVGHNMTELKVNNVSILFSYETPVAGHDEQGAFRTDKYYSVTTSRHINKYLGGKDIGREVTQDFINEVANNSYLTMRFHEVSDLV